ncbi:DUF397 domain-containing protein [Spirillospora sp. NPDC029432]|uniref:DUF397 domain-containing protein n=1 Tax=Spirillospora sp. NPDC029432 TaxID=3154599 RepID=UPI00345282F5
MIVQWRKSSYSGGADDKACVEVGRHAQGVGVRDSKDPEGVRLSLSVDQFAGLVEGIKQGAYGR